MEPVSSIIALTLKFIAGAIVIGWAWAYIREFFAAFLIPAIRKHVSNTLADGIATIISWIDAPASAVRRVASETMASFKKHVLGIKTTYERKSVHSVQENTATYIVTQSGSVTETIRERTIPMDNIPPAIRGEFIKHHGKSVPADVKEDFERIVKEKLKLAT